MQILLACVMHVQILISSLFNIDYNYYYVPMSYN